jgi:uncharacterized protein (TIGR02246 family)
MIVAAFKPESRHLSSLLLRSVDDRIRPEADADDPKHLEGTPMNRKQSGVFVFLCLVLLAAGCSRSQPGEQPDTRAHDAAKNKDPEKSASYYTEDAVLMFAGAPDAYGKAAIREAIGQLMQDPAFTVSWQVESVEVARSGELAIEQETYSLTMMDPQSQSPVTEKGHGLVVWKKQADGWKAYLDVMVSDAP